MWVTKLMISQVKKKDFLPKNDQFWPKIGIFGQFGSGLAGSFGALLVGWSVVVACGPYFARHLHLLCILGIHQVEDNRYHYISGLFSTRTTCFKKKIVKVARSHADFFIFETFRRNCPALDVKHAILRLKNNSE